MIVQREFPTGTAGMGLALAHYTDTLITERVQQRPAKRVPGQLCVLPQGHTVLKADKAKQWEPVVRSAESKP